MEIKKLFRRFKNNNNGRYIFKIGINDKKEKLQKKSLLDCVYYMLDEIKFN